MKKSLEIQFMLKFKIIKVKDYLHYIYQMVSFGAHFLKINNTALIFC
jgi:hypothetical protein